MKRPNFDNAVKVPSATATAPGMSVSTVAVATMMLDATLNDVLARALGRHGFGALKPNWALALHRMGEASWRGIDLVPLLFNAAATSYTVRRLEGMGLVEICDSPDDGRANLIRRTETGARVAEIVDRIVIERVGGNMIRLQDSDSTVCEVVDLTDVVKALTRVLNLPAEAG